MKTNERINENIFSEDMPCDKEYILTEKLPIESPAAVISLESYPEKAHEKGRLFSEEITKGFVSDFERSEKYCREGQTADLMAHVSTFHVAQGMIFVTYYANTVEASEDAKNQTARFVYCPLERPEEKTFVDVQAAGDTLCGRPVVMVYDTILMPKDDDTLYILWTANIGGKYYRLYRSFTISTKALGEICVNRFKVGDTVNDFSTDGIKKALAANGIEMKTMYSDIGIMQKLSKRVENGEAWYYSGAYSGDFTCIIKSRDFETWEYVSQPDFPNSSKWENATYAVGDKVYYFVRQHDETQYGFLTAYDLKEKKWAQPVLIADCQSRSDFIMYKDELYLFHAPADREHIGLIKIDMENIADSTPVFIAHMDTSCFYPFVQYFSKDRLAMSYTVARKHIRLAEFDMENYVK